MSREADGPVDFLPAYEVDRDAGAGCGCALCSGYSSMSQYSAGIMTPIEVAGDIEASARRAFLQRFSNRQHEERLRNAIRWLEEFTRRHIQQNPN